MKIKPILFDDVRTLLISVFMDMGIPPAIDGSMCLVRDLFGKVRLVVAIDLEEDEGTRTFLDQISSKIAKVLGPRAYPPDNAVIFLDRPVLAELAKSAQTVHQGVRLVDRLVTGREWATVPSREDLNLPIGSGPRRIVFYSVKGGVGRSTTASVAAWHLARSGKRVMVVDLDLESPGLSSAMLEMDRRPEHGVVDWFVEDMLDQSANLLERMAGTPAWAQDLEGEVHIIPACGRDPGEYLAKLGRVYFDAGQPWPKRLATLLDRLESFYGPDVVIIESRSGLHDLAAATVTDLGADVLLFAMDSPSTWDDYEILFRHWKDYGVVRSIRERLWIVSALTPELGTESYLGGFRESAWNLFRDCLYDEVPPSESLDTDYFSFDVQEIGAPHDPFPIYWNRGLAAGSTLRSFEDSTVAQAYSSFLLRLDQMVKAIGDQ